MASQRSLQLHERFPTSATTATVRLR